MKPDPNFEKLLREFEDAVRMEVHTRFAVGFDHPLHGKKRVATGEARKNIREYVENIEKHRNLTHEDIPNG